MKRFQNCSYYIAQNFVLLGLGVCLIHLAILFQIKTQDFTAVFLGQGFGMATGAIISALVIHRFPYEPQFAVALLIMIVSNALSPWTNSLSGFTICRFIAFTSIGFFDTGTLLYFFKWRSILISFDYTVLLRGGLRTFLT